MPSANAAGVGAARADVGDIAMSSGRLRHILSTKRGLWTALVATGFAAGLLFGPSLATAAQRALPVLITKVFVTNTASDPVLTREAARRFSVFVEGRTGDGTGPGCVSVPLPAGRVLIEHVDTEFAVDVWSYLQLHANVQSSSGGGIARTDALVSLAGVPLSLTEFQGQVEALTDALVIHDGDTGRLGDLWRSADLPLLVCSRDADENLGSSGTVIVSGYVLP